MSYTAFEVIVNSEYQNHIFCWWMGWVIYISKKKLSYFWWRIIFVYRDPQFWTGLHATIPDTGSTLKWASSCQQPTMAVLGSSAPDSSSHRYCGYISLENTHEITFGTSDCVLSKKKFLCQEVYSKLAAKFVYYFHLCFVKASLKEMRKIRLNVELFFF